MRVVKRLLFIAAGFLFLCLCGSAFANPSFDRFLISAKSEPAGTTFAAASEARTPESDNAVPDPQVVESDSTTIGADVAVTGSSGCNGGFGGVAVLLLALFGLPVRRRPRRPR